MLQLIYLSTATHAMNDAELEALLSVSVRNNQHLGITGLLIVKDRTFMQALEGEEAVVRRLYDIIAQDERHKNIIKISEEHIDARQFSQWSMGFKNLEKLPPVESQKLVNFGKIDVTSPEFTENPELIHELFQTFITQG